MAAYIQDSGQLGHYPAKPNVPAGLHFEWGNLLVASSDDLDADLKLIGLIYIHGW